MDMYKPHGTANLKSSKG